MNNWLWTQCVQILNAPQDLDAPKFYNFEAFYFIFLYVADETSASNHFCDKNHFLKLGVLPATYEVNDVRMLQLFYKVNFRRNSLPITLWQPWKLDFVPRNLSACVMIDSMINNFVSSSAQFLVKSWKTTLGWRFRNNRRIWLKLLLVSVIGLPEVLINWFCSFCFFWLSF